MKKILATMSAATMSAATMLTACSTTKKAEVATPDVTTSTSNNTTAVAAPSNRALAHVIIYTTKADYSNLVPVTMNSERTKIVSYPAKSDIRLSAKPVALADGWLLDRRGIGPNTVFTDYTYEEYSSLEKTPSASQLMEHIIEKYPLLELRDCGTEHLSLDQLNDLIRSGLKGCKTMIPPMR